MLNIFKALTFCSFIIIFRSFRRSFGHRAFHRPAVISIINTSFKATSKTSSTELALKLKSNQTKSCVKPSLIKCQWEHEEHKSPCKTQQSIQSFSWCLSLLYRFFFATLFAVIFFTTLYDAMTDEKSKLEHEITLRYTFSYLKIFSHTFLFRGHRFDFVLDTEKLETACVAWRHCEQRWWYSISAWHKIHCCLYDLHFAQELFCVLLSDGESN